MHRKIGIALITLLVASSVTLAADESDKKNQLHLSNMKCEDFLMLDDMIKPKVVYYGVAYARSGKPEDAVIDVEGTEKIIPVITEICTKEPKASFWQKLKTEVKKVF